MRAEERRRWLRVVPALALRHHPLCGWFATDTLTIGAVEVCAGCAMFLPGLALGAASGAVAIGQGADAWALMAAGFVLGAPQLLTYAHRFGRGVRAAIKAVGGAGLGLVTAAWFAIPVPWSLRLAGAGALLVALTAMQALRLRSIVTTCRRCPWAMDWERCPGFRAGAEGATQ
jgi:hypothetical protein